MKSHPREFENRGRVGVADKYVQHLMQFSLRLKSQHAFEDVMRAASSVKKELQDVIRFPKEGKGQGQAVRH